jgi:site-specific DNA-cytosine methylase
MKVLELFAGSRSIGKAAESLGHTVFSVDWEKYDSINLSIDIEELQTTQVPFTPDFVWASFDCTTYTIAAISTHRNGVIPKTEYAKKCDRVNQHTISLIKNWLLINPDMVFFIENPRGMLRKMPFMQEFKRYTVWYCTYGDERAKPTDIWTNSQTWTPKPMCHNGNKACHHSPAPRGSKTGTQGRKGSFNRSKIPTELCVEILKSKV